MIFQLKQKAELEELEQREELLQQLRQRQEERKKNNKKLQQLRVVENGGSEILGKISLLEGHKQLVDQSNERILARLGSYSMVG